MYRLIVIFRSKLLVFLTHHLALPVLKLVRKPQMFPYTREQLASFPEGTLGKDLVQLLDTNNFRLLTHYAKHDMKHILLDYNTTDEGEVCLQCFMLGNRHFSFPVISTILFGLVTMPEYWPSFFKAFKRGRSAVYFDDWNWGTLVTQPTASVKKEIFKSMYHE